VKLSVFGMGYVGTVSAACMAKLGHNVVGVDVQAHKVDAIRAGKCVLIEPELELLVSKAVEAGKLSATTDAARAVAESDVSLVCVGTPSERTGAINLAHLLDVCRQIGQGLANHPGRHIVAIRSTTMPGAVSRELVPALEQASGLSCGKDFGVCTNPEFLREASAVRDFFHPPMIVLGQSSDADGEVMERLYQGLEAPVFRCGLDEAMMVKYACNGYHAVKVTFGNEIGMLCSLLGLDSHRVMEIFCQDKQLNISARYLMPGFAFGGSCLPKDVRAMIALGREQFLSVPMIESLMASNAYQIDRAVKQVLATGKKRIGVLGLSFKDDTDDLRESPAVEVVERLLGKGCDIAIHDKDVRLSQIFGANLSEIENRLPHVATLMKDTLEEVLDHAEVLLLTKGSKAYRDLPDKLRQGQTVIDLVRLFAPGDMPPQQYQCLCG